MNQNKKRIVIHAGPGKTGSSAIQAWLCNHRQVLSAQGIYYPKHALAKNGISSGHIHDLLTSVDGKWRPDQQKINQLLKGFEARKEHTLLLSSEFFFHNIVALHQAIPNAEFVAYVRNPVELLESNYNQSVKRHSQTQQFTPPTSLDHYLWNYLSTLFERLPPEQLWLRPYHSTLFVNGNIVADLLDLLGTQLSIEQCQTREHINPSFTFPALEFKRLVNHFPLGALESELDVALQDCSIGLKAYSLMAAESYQRLTQQNIKLMQAFIEKYQQAQLKDLLNTFLKAQQKTIVSHQNISLTQLQAVSVFIQNKYQPIYQRLSALIALHPNLIIDNPIIYQVFGLESNDSDFSMDQDLLKTASQFAIHDNNKHKVLNDLAAYFLTSGEFNKAVDFAQAGYQLSAKTNADKTRLNQVLIQCNQQKMPVNADLNLQAPIPFERKLKNKVKSCVAKLGI